MWRRAATIFAIVLVGVALGSHAAEIAVIAEAAKRPPTGIATRPLLMEQLQRQGGRHLVMVRYGPQHNIHADWVYNRADIDHSAIVWAREMSAERNQELLDYYHDRQVWLLEPDVNPMAVVPYHSAP